MRYLDECETEEDYQEELEARCAAVDYVYHAVKDGTIVLNK